MFNTLIEQSINMNAPETPKAKATKRPTLFLELEYVPHPEMSDIKHVLREHAKSGAHIDGTAVLQIIARLNVIDETDAAHLAQSARIGIEVQKKLSQPRQVRQYRKILIIYGLD